MSIVNVPIVLEAEEGITLTKFKIAIKSNKKVEDLYNFVNSDSTSNLKGRLFTLNQDNVEVSKDVLVSTLIKGSDGNVGLKVCLKIVEEIQVEEVKEKSHGLTIEIPEVEQPIQDVEVNSVTIVQKNASGLSYYLFSTNTIVEIGYTLNGKDCRIEETYFNTGDCTNFHYRICELIQCAQKKGFRGRYTFKAIVLGGK